MVAWVKAFAGALLALGLNAVSALIEPWFLLGTIPLSLIIFITVFVWERNPQALRRVPVAGRWFERPDFSVRVRTERWSRFRQEWRVLELELEVTNNTAQTKQITNWEWSWNNAGGGTVDMEAWRHIDDVLRGRQQLPSIVDANSVVRGWLVNVFRNDPSLAGTVPYALLMRDESSVPYVVHDDFGAGGQALGVK